MASTDRTALVTGASRGVGRAIALRLAAEGVDVLVHYARDEAAAQTVVKQIHASGGRAAVAGADFSDATAIDDLIHAAAAHLNGRGLHVLVNNAGVLDGTPFGLLGTVRARARSQCRVDHRLRPAGHPR